MSASPRTGGFLLIALFLAPLLCTACTASRRAAVPPDLIDHAEVPGFSSQIRYFPRDADDVDAFKQDILQAAGREMAYLRTQGHEGPLPPSAYLAISGGGDDGAFGAGFLNGWTKAGTRPQFKLVTGISTGALISPFAFLGSMYDAQLRLFYTTISMQDVAVERSVLSVLFDDAMADNTPLRNLVKKYVTQDVVDAVAAEHAKGRILLIGTTNLDARRPVLWNLTKIAASRHPGALKLFQEVLIASAAIPGTFPPVMIDVEVDHKPFQEMHVDGGTVAQVFIYPAAIRITEFAREHGLERERTLYIIRNARLDPQWAQVDRRVLPIAFRAVATLIQYQGLGDLYRIYSVTRRDDVDFNLAFIPPTFDTLHTTDFDTAYMRKLFEVGFESAAAGYSWYKEPPVILSTQGLTQGGRR
jgi:Patatin-like phospholipase